jgi:hypothetical protein
VLVNTMMLVSFPSLWVSQLKKEDEEVYSGSQFWRFQSMVTWPNCFGPMTRQNIMEGHTAGDATSWQPGSDRKARRT